MNNYKQRPKRRKTEGYFPKYTDRAGKYLEYNMPAAQARDILKNRTGDDAKMDPQDYLCAYLNTEAGLLGYVTRVILTK